MKDFYGTPLSASIPQLDYQNIVTIHNGLNDASEKFEYYTPDSDGIFVLGCSYVEGSYVYIADEDFTGNMRLMSGCSGNGSVGQTNGMSLAFKGHRYKGSYRRGQWFFIPYKQ